MECKIGKSKEDCVLHNLGLPCEDCNADSEEDIKKILRQSHNCADCAGREVCPLADVLDWIIDNPEYIRLLMEKLGDSMSKSALSLQHSGISIDFDSVINTCLVSTIAGAKFGNEHPIPVKEEGKVEPTDAPEVVWEIDDEGHHRIKVGDKVGDAHSYNSIATLVDGDNIYIAVTECYAGYLPAETVLKVEKVPNVKQGFFKGNMFK